MNSGSTLGIAHVHTVAGREPHLFTSPPFTAVNEAYKMLEEEQKQYCEGVVEEAQVVTEVQVCECEGVSVMVRVRGSIVRGSGGGGPGGE